MKTHSSPNMPPKAKAGVKPKAKAGNVNEQKKLMRAKACIRRMRRTAAVARAVEQEMLMMVQHDLDGELDDELIDESELLYEELCKDSEKMKVSMHQWMCWCLQYKPKAPTAPA